jgi:hypothetical protein
VGTGDLLEGLQGSEGLEGAFVEGRGGLGVDCHAVEVGRGQERAFVASVTFLLEEFP